MRLKGRHWLMLWLLVFLCVLIAITTRQTAGFRTARRLRDLREERTGARGPPGRPRAPDPGGLEPAGAGADRRARRWACTSRPTPSSSSSPLPAAGPERALMAKPQRPHRRHPVRLRARRSWRCSTRAAQLQIVEARALGARGARGQRTEKVVLPARRGALYDRNGVPLAITQEFYHVGIAPNELEDVARGVRACWSGTSASPPPALDREFRARKRWIYLHGPFNATQVQPLRRGQRHSPRRRIPAILSRRASWPGRSSAGWRPSAPVGAAGLELSLDSLLTGRPGRGGAAQGPGGPPLRLARPDDPRPGRRATTSCSRIDAELQEIAERGLDDAHRRR